LGLRRLLAADKRFDFTDLSFPRFRRLEGSYSDARDLIRRDLSTAAVVLTIDTPVITNIASVQDELAVSPPARRSREVRPAYRPRGWCRRRRRPPGPRSGRQQAPGARRRPKPEIQRNRPRATQRNPRHVGPITVAENSGGMRAMDVCAIATHSLLLGSGPSLARSVFFAPSFDVAPSHSGSRCLWPKPLRRPRVAPLAVAERQDWSRAAFSAKRKPSFKGWLDSEDRYRMPKLEERK
jgi:hypothetical protein